MFRATTDSRLTGRSAGVLLHPTSLPGPFGIGDMGPRAHAWVEALARAGQRWWQVLPLGPTGYGDSPYQSFSAFAGNPNLLSPETLAAEGLLPADFRSLADLGRLPADRVEYERVIPLKAALLARCYESFRAGATPALGTPFEEFCGREASWLDDFALFMALKEVQGGGSWQDWPAPLRLREPAALAEARHTLADATDRHRFGQFLFRRQYAELRHHAHAVGVQLLGDVPIFVAGDSADVWANPELFQLDSQRRPRVVAGVPPDYFSATGQLWGNPLYDWEAHRRTGYAWWIARLRATLAQVDLIRLDHFRGFEAYWEVPAGAATAAGGRWVPGPGADLLEALGQALGGLPLIAEDLGVITPAVDALRRRFGLPGMRILQFAFGGAVETRFRPHHFETHTVVYTGTHDNDTTRGWFARITPEERRFTLRYLNTDGSEIAWDLTRLAWGSVAQLAIAPLQDLLDLDSAARMNLPGQPSGNWRWRLAEHQLSPALWDRLGELTQLYGRT